MKVRLHYKTVKNSVLSEYFLSCKRYAYEDKCAVWIFYDSSKYYNLPSDRVWNKHALHTCQSSVGGWPYTRTGEREYPRTQTLPDVSRLVSQSEDQHPQCCHYTLPWVPRQLRYHWWVVRMYLVLSGPVSVWTGCTVGPLSRGLLECQWLPSQPTERKIKVKKVRDRKRDQWCLIIKPAQLKQVSLNLNWNFVSHFCIWVSSPMPLVWIIWRHTEFFLVGNIKATVWRHKIPKWRHAWSLIPKWQISRNFLFLLYFHQFDGNLFED